MSLNNIKIEEKINIDNDILKDSPDYEDYTENVVIENKRGCCKTIGGRCCGIGSNGCGGNCGACSKKSMCKKGSIII